MCIGDIASDTLDAQEQAYMSEVAVARFPAHAFALRSNDDGITWGLLEPRHGDTAPFKITICRIAPCIMVMLEDREARRQFRALPDLEAAMDFIEAISDEAILAAAGLGDRERALH